MMTPKSAASSVHHSPSPSPSGMMLSRGSARRSRPFRRSPAPRRLSVRGIIGFDIAFADATGHLDMWDGKVFSNESHTSGDYWVNATRISLWKMS